MQLSNLIRSQFVSPLEYIRRNKSFSTVNMARVLTPLPFIFLLSKEVTCYFKHVSPAYVEQYVAIMRWRNTTPCVFACTQTHMNMNSKVHNFQKLKNISLKAVNFFNNKYKSNLFE